MKTTKDRVLSKVNKSNPWHIRTDQLPEFEKVMPKTVPVQFVFAGCEDPVDNFLLRSFAHSGNVQLT